MSQYLPYLILVGFFLILGLMVAATIYLLLRLSRWVHRRISTNKREGGFETPAFQVRVRKLVYVQLCIYAALGIAAIVTIVRQGTIMSLTGLWILGGFILSGVIAAIVILSMMENNAGGKSEVYAQGRQRLFAVGQGQGIREGRVVGVAFVPGALPNPHWGWVVGGWWR